MVTAHTHTHKAEVAILIPDKTDFKLKMAKRNLLIKWWEKKALIQERKKMWHSENQDILIVNHFQGQLQELLITHSNAVCTHC